MDYGFAPGRRLGRDRQDDRLRMMFRNQANTTLVFRRRMRSLRQFIRHLEAPGNAEEPVGELLVGAHANGEGLLFVPMYAGQDGASDFETLEETLANPARSVAISDALIGHAEGDPITHSVHFKGCNIGKVRPYLIKLKEAFDNHVMVTAPKHFHGLTSVRREGVFEYMAYEFVLRRSTAFPNRNSLVAAFQAAGFTFIDGSNVPNGAWEDRHANWQNRWIPRRIFRTRDRKVPTPLGVNIGRRRTINTPQQFRVDRRSPFKWTLMFPIAMAVPEDPAQRLQFLQDGLRADDRFQAGHAFPIHERLGYPTLDDFFAGYVWNPERWRVNRGRYEGNPVWNLFCRGRRVVYTVVIPITNPANGNLVFNFYPNEGSPHAAITIGLQVDDTDYFEMV